MSDEERDLRKYSRRSAIGLMGVGGGLAATETLGFTNLTADRGLSVSVADDSNAALEITVDEGQEGDYNDTLEDSPFTGDSNVKFENTGNEDISSEEDDALVVDISETDDGSIEIRDNGVEGTFDVSDSPADTDEGATAEVDLPTSTDAILEFSPTDGTGNGDSPTVTITTTAALSDGSELTVERTNVTFKEE